MRFSEGLDELERRVGHGELTARVSFSPDTIAVPQSEGTWRTGPNAGVIIKNYTTPGTGPHYLDGPLLENHDRYFAQIAAELLDIGPQHGMIEAADDLLGEAQQRIPRKTGALADSGRSEVSDDGVTIHAKGGVGAHV